MSPEKNKEVKLLQVIVSWILVFGVLHLFGVISFYHTVSWYDALLHGLSGVWIAFAAWAWFRYAYGERYSHNNADVLFTLGIAALLGTMWEFFEFGVDVVIVPVWNIPMLQGGVADTMSDYKKCRFRVIQTPDIQDARILEDVLIKLLKPKYNQ